MNLRSILLLAATLTTSVAHGQPAPDPAKPVDPAELAYQEGKRLYDIQEWDAAIAKFKEAYKSRSDAASLFNIAQSYRLKGDCAQAITYYKTYKRNYPTAENLPKVEKFITDLEATPCATPTTPPVGTNPVVTNPDPTKLDPSKPDPTKPDPTRPDPALKVIEPVTPPSETDPGRTKRIVGYALLGVGGVAITGGVLFGLGARAKANTVETSMGVWDPKLESDGQRAQRNSRIAFGVGALAVIGGGVLVILNLNSGNEKSQVSLAPTGDGGAFVWSGHW